MSKHTPISAAITARPPAAQCDASTYLRAAHPRRSPAATCAINHNQAPPGTDRALARARSRALLGGRASEVGARDEHGGGLRVLVHAHAPQRLEAPLGWAGGTATG